MTKTSSLLLSCENYEGRSELWQQHWLCFRASFNLFPLLHFFHCYPNNFPETPLIFHFLFKDFFETLWVPNFSIFCFSFLYPPYLLFKINKVKLFSAEHFEHNICSANWHVSPPISSSSLSIICSVQKLSLRCFLLFSLSVRINLSHPNPIVCLQDASVSSMGLKFHWKVWPTYQIWIICNKIKNVYITIVK